MRWLYPDPADKREATARAAIDKQVDAWWQAFAANCAEIQRVFKSQSKFDLVAFMRRALSTIDDRIMWEFGPGVKRKGNERLVLTPESDHEIEPLVRRILARAPKIDCWEFYLYRLAEDVEQAIATVEARTGGNLRGASVRCTLGEGNLVDVLFHMPDRKGDANDARGAAFIGAESLFGEQRLTFWTGVIDAVDSKQGLKGWVPIEKSQATYEALLQSIRDRLPAKPVQQWDPESDGMMWSSFKCEPVEAEDYAGVDDLVGGVTGIAAALGPMTGSRLFASERFSKHGEVLGYLKMDFSNIGWDDRVRVRGELEDELTPLLMKTAGIWGGGTGLRYAYVFMAFTDVLKSADVLRGVLRKKKASKRSWIQFFDATLADEWIGIYPDSPPPPMKPREE
jgi:hypothetical protein